MTTTIDFTQRVATPLGPVETSILRHELECACLDLNNDIAYEMICALEEFPILADFRLHLTSANLATAQVMAIAWEAGRRYGLLEAFSQVAGMIEHPDPLTRPHIPKPPASVPIAGYVGPNATVIPRRPLTQTPTAQNAAPHRPRSPQPAADPVPADLPDSDELEPPRFPQFVPYRSPFQRQAHEDATAVIPATGDNLP